MITDSVIIDEVLSGNKRAFEILVKKYQIIIYNYILRITLNKEDSEDITQEVFIRAYKNIYQLKDKDNFGNWLFKIAVNAINTNFKCKKRFEVLDEKFTNNVECDLIDTPEEVVKIKEKNIELLKKLEILNNDEKNAMILKYINGFSYREISEIMGIKEDTIKMKVFRAKKKLYNHVKNCASEGDEIYEM